MRLVSFGERYHERPGIVLEENRILDLERALPGGPRSWRQILDLGRLGEACDLAARGACPAEVLLGLNRIRLAPPIPDPSKVICLGLNYRDHAEEQRKPLPDKPLLFAKAPSALIGPGEPIILPENEPEVDYEVELAFIIGRRARRVPAARAFDYILGYTIFNDVTGRLAQRTERQWLRAKGFETFAPMGPWIVTTDEIADPHALKLECRVNGELRQQSRTDQLIFKLPFLVEYLSRDMTLEPGDVISTGTPGGVGVYRDPPVYLKAGDVISLEIEGIGRLENPVAVG
jgi:2-keto-4-pentenoate hydratase/2-oxohepta-3-ene-1,7-dioic acid hydratase in catechol pathway